ncbi:MAG: hypothetical protein CMP66_01205 [Flavobacteriales bacterium]|nr:hypothetical protein [Flavobacteriales bacterium]
MKKTLLLFLFPFFSFAQNGVVKSVMLDSVMITAVKDGFSVEEFIHYVKTDTTFYQGFKNLRYYNHDYHSDLKVLKKSGEVLGSLFRSGKYVITNEQLIVHIDSTFDDGRIFNRKGEYRHYTPKFFDKIFFPEDTIGVTKFARNGEKGIEDENKQNEEDAKTIVFSIGSGDVDAGNSKNKKKLAVFDIDMQQYYDYLISQEIFQDSIDCYSFTVRMKEGLEKKDEEQVLIRELVSYFDKKTFNVMYRKYIMSYRYWFIDLDVSVEVYMDYADTELVPSYIHYNGFWDIPFAKPEHADFKLWNYNFKL